MQSRSADYGQKASHTTEKFAAGDEATQSNVHLNDHSRSVLDSEEEARHWLSVHSPPRPQHRLLRQILGQYLDHCPDICALPRLRAQDLQRLVEGAPTADEHVPDSGRSSRKTSAPGQLESWSLHMPVFPAIKQI